MSRGSLIRLVMLALLWGSGFLWIKLALRGFTPVQIVLVRLALGALVLIPVALHRGLRFPADRTTWGHLFVAALVANAIPYTLFGIGEQTVDSGVAGVLNATTPLWTALIAFVVGTDRTATWSRGAGLTLGFVGAVVIFTPWESASEVASWGGLAILGASASYGVSYVYMGKFLTNRGIPPIMLSAAQLAAGTILMILALPLGGLTAPDFRLDAVVSLLILGVLGTGAAYALNYRLITDDGPTLASTVTYLLPVVAVVLGFLVVNEQVAAFMVLGMLLVLAGVALVQRRPQRGKVSDPLPLGRNRNGRR
ncbi:MULTISPECIES: DMT family transporter [unclassified Solwaraspora]|uniref:DMT family transporter n=1 Tax=unclassified Solwaraspora TaxID=2627926 RepID=UPI00248AC319|nr:MULTISPECIES: DMT family transporter [unclassified Solwaraspora]WBB95263.1 DMT family transporter [Solwaraspora sp. WMMA2059]WBC20831.1 DMT family transporter [Solwaraspora sp. WMMA2080]WJK37037.1 DMT family transporter [Solwaraspora sp. WMMA2065]